MSRNGDEPSDDAVLGRVTDPTALDQERGGLAQLEASAPRGWSGRRVRLRLPRSVQCRSCHGGGCDDCGRSGAFRLAEDPRDRELEIDIPSFVKPVVAVRLPRPFGDGSPVRQLLVVFEESSEPDPRMVLIDAPLVPVSPAAVEAVPSWPRGYTLAAYVAAAVAVVAALARLLAG